MNIIGKKRGRKQKIQRSILQSVVFQWYKIQYFFTGTNYLRLKLFVIRTFILFLKIKMYACRTFWLSCFFIKDVDNAAYTVGKTFQRGKRPVLLWQSRLKKMSSASGYERNLMRLIVRTNTTLPHRRIRLTGHIAGDCSSLWILQR